jgi:hypothetical protein
VVTAATTVIASAIASAGMASAGMAAALVSGAVFVGWFVAGIAYVTLWIVGFVTVEVVEGLGTALGHWACVSVSRIVTIVDVAVEAAVAVVPGTGTDEDSAGEPVGAIVAVRGTRVWGVVKVAVGADGCGSNADGDLSRCYRYTAHEGNREDGECQRLTYGHVFSFTN